MTAPVTSWGDRYDHALERARAVAQGWARGDDDDDRIAVYRAIAAAVVGPVRLVIGETAPGLDEDARLRVMTAVVSAVAWRLPGAVAEAVAAELARPEPLPFAPPAAGSWVRERWAPSRSTRARASVGPEWHGAWHVFGGDVRTGDARTHEVKGRTLCGWIIVLRRYRLEGPLELGADAAVADAMPGVETCGRCRQRVEPEA